MTNSINAAASTFAVGREHTAVRNTDGSLSIYDGEGDLRFTLPAGVKVDLVPMLVELFEREVNNAFENGRVAGAEGIKIQLRMLIGAAEVQP